MAVTITATKYFTGTGPIKFSEIRDTFGDLPGSNIRLSDYKRNSTGDIDWEEDNTITPRVPDATENIELPDTNDNIQLSDYRNTIKEYNVEQTGNEEERVYSDGDTTDWNNNLSKNVTKNYDVTGTIYSNETNKYALTFVEGNYNNLEINVSGNIYGEGGAAGGGSGGGALYLHNKYDGDKVRLNIANNGKIWAGGGGGNIGNAGSPPNALSCYENKNWNARNLFGHFKLCNNTSNWCNRPITTCKSNGPSHWPSGDGHSNSTNKPAGIINSNVTWNKAKSLGRNRSRCRGGVITNRGGINANTVINYADRNNTYQCTRDWEMNCSGRKGNTVTGGNAGNAGNGGDGKGWTNRNTAINSSPHVGNSGNAGNCINCDIKGTTSCGNAGNDGNSGGDWGQAASSGGAGGIAIRKMKVIYNNANSNTVKGSINNI